MLFAASRVKCALLLIYSLLLIMLVLLPQIFGYLNSLSIMLPFTFYDLCSTLLYATINKQNTDIGDEVVNVFNHI